MEFLFWTSLVSLVFSPRWYQLFAHCLALSSWVSIWRMKGALSYQGDMSHGSTFDLCYMVFCSVVFFPSVLLLGKWCTRGGERMHRNSTVVLSPWADTWFMEILSEPLASRMWMAILAYQGTLLCTSGAGGYACAKWKMGYSGRILLLIYHLNTHCLCCTVQIQIVLIGINFRGAMDVCSKFSTICLSALHAAVSTNSIVWVANLSPPLFFWHRSEPSIQYKYIFHEASPKAHRLVRSSWIPWIQVSSQDERMIIPHRWPQRISAVVKIPRMGASIMKANTMACLILS